MALLPPDVRATRDFRIIKGLDDNIVRTDYEIDSGVSSIASGEWVILDSSNKVTKASGESLANPAQNAVLCWTKFERDDTYNGQTDVIATNQITAVTGSYQAETTFFESTGTFNPGDLLVVQESSTTAGQGVLNAVAGASATAEQIAGAVAKVVLLASGVLTYRTLGEA